MLNQHSTTWTDENQREAYMEMKTQLDIMLPYTREGLKNVILTYDC